MEKENEPLIEEGRDGASQSRGRSQRVTFVHRIFLALLFLIIASFWYPEIRNALPKVNHGCKGRHSVERRALKILKKNPLIGRLQ